MAPAQPDADFNRLFTRAGDGWTGGDGTLSVKLPDGRTLWLFGDTFLGQVRPDGSRPAQSPLIRNCLVVQKGQKLTTHHGGSIRDPEAFLVSEGSQSWYWPGDGTVQGNRLQIFFHCFRQVSEGMWGWAWKDTVIASLRLPDLVLERVIRADHHNGVAYGAALHEEGRWIYIFGTEQRGVVKHMHLARAPQADLNTAWGYWTGQNWSPDPQASRAVLAGVSSQFGVVGLGKGLGLVTMDDRQPFSNRLVVYLAESPMGPWRGPIEIYRAPEAGAGISAYNPFVHPQFKSPDGILISYNINHVHDPDVIYEDASLYRPRFIRVDLDRLAATTLK
ncbi:MAG: DUF5005 domain-containing protein [Desulfobacterales bacterium]